MQNNWLCKLTTTLNTETTSWSLSSEGSLVGPENNVYDAERCVRATLFSGTLRAEVEFSELDVQRCRVPPPGSAHVNIMGEAEQL